MFAEAIYLIRHFSYKSAYIWYIFPGGGYNETKTLQQKLIAYRSACILGVRSCDWPTGFQ